MHLEVDVCVKIHIVTFKMNVLMSAYLLTSQSKSFIIDSDIKVNDDRIFKHPHMKQFDQWHSL